ncbi:hypothetical protein HK101_002129 [Irineochytrium annulatum]|nr:hypothetical protein HK101_002129 [Irineochytrium annulatum]
MPTMTEVQDDQPLEQPGRDRMDPLAHSTLPVVAKTHPDIPTADRILAELEADLQEVSSVAQLKPPSGTRGLQHGPRLVMGKLFRIIPMGFASQGLVDSVCVAGLRWMCLTMNITGWVGDSDASNPTYPLIAARWTDFADIPLLIGSLVEFGANPDLVSDMLAALITHVLSSRADAASDDAFKPYELMAVAILSRSINARSHFRSRANLMALLPPCRFVTMAAQALDGELVLVINCDLANAPRWAAWVRVTGVSAMSQLVTLLDDRLATVVPERFRGWRLPKKKVVDCLLGEGPAEVTGSLYRNWRIVDGTTGKSLVNAEAPANLKRVEVVENFVRNAPGWVAALEDGGKGFRVLVLGDMERAGMSCMNAMRDFEGMRAEVEVLGMMAEDDVKSISLAL